MSKSIEVAGVPLIPTDTFGNAIPLKKLIIALVGSFTYPRLKWVNHTEITNAEMLGELPEQGVLFVSNHQTYYADVVAMLHVFAGVKRDADPIVPMLVARHKRDRPIRNPFYLLNPRINTYYVAADETMKAGLLPRILAYVGAITVKRTWREAGKEIKREVDKSDTQNIGEALTDGWVITFPQGTTRPFAPGRKGTAHLIKQYRPLVVPVVIDGFRRAFDKKGLFIKKRGVTLKMTFKDPLTIDYDAPVEAILDQVMHAIEQSEEYHFKFGDPAPDKNAFGY